MAREAGFEHCLIGGLALMATSFPRMARKSLRSPLLVGATEIILQSRYPGGIVVTKIGAAP